MLPNKFLLSGKQILLPQQMFPGVANGKTSPSATMNNTTAMSTKTSPQNITWLYHKSFAIILSHSRRTMRAKYP